MIVAVIPLGDRLTIHRKIEIRAWEHSYDSLPADIKQHFTEQEVDAYSTGATMFQELAAKSGSEAIQQLLGNLAQDQPMFVEMFSTNDQPWETWFGFTIVMNEYQPRIRLPRPNVELPYSTPADIVQLYRAFGGVTNSSFCGGFMKTEELIRDGNEFIMGHHEIASDGYHFFFNYGNGDYAGWDNLGSGIMYDHERGTLSECSFSELYESLFADMNRDRFSDAFGDLD